MEPKRVSHLILELAALLSQHGDMEVVVKTCSPGGMSGRYGRGTSVQRVTLDSLAQITELTPHVEYKLYGTCDDDGDELTVPGMRLDGREPVAVIEM